MQQIKPQVLYNDLGVIDYNQAWDLQTSVLQELIRIKRAFPNDKADGFVQEHQLLFCEHQPVYTLGKSGKMDHLLLSEAELERKGFTFYKINRGGDITYHGPGQITGYPIFDLEEFFRDVHLYVRSLEEVIIRTIDEYGLIGYREEGFTGVWLGEKSNKRKICAIGVHLSRWVTMHGFALNVNTNLSHFNYVVPCGIADDNKSVTSIAKELSQEIDLSEVKQKLKNHFKDVFDFEYRIQS